jgi:hypothetical protein
MAPSGPPALPTTHCPLHPPGQCVSHPCHPCPYPWPFAPTLPKQQSRPGLCRSHLRPADRVWPHAYRCAASAKLSLHAGSCTCLERDQACILAASGGPRLKSLDLPKSLYIHTYIHTHTRTCSCAESAWPLSCPVLSCPALRLTQKKPFSPPVPPLQLSALPCPAQPALHCNAPHCTILHCAVPWAACIRRVCCRVPSHYHRPGPHFLSPIHRLHANVIVPIVPGPALCHGYLVIYPLTQPGGVRASNPYLLVRDMNEDRPHTGL